MNGRVIAGMFLTLFLASTLVGATVKTPATVFDVSASGMSPKTLQSSSYASSWTVFLDMNVLPENAVPVPWFKYSDGGTSSVANGILTIDTTPEGACLEYCHGHHDDGSDWYDNVDNSRGWVVEARLRVDDATENNGYVSIWTNDRTWMETLHIYKDHIEFYPGTDYPPIYMDTTDTYHIYTIVGKKNSYKVYVDGVLKIDYTITSGAGTFGLIFGDMNMVTKTKSYWDYVAYTTSPYPYPYEEFIIVGDNVDLTTLELWHYYFDPFAGTFPVADKTLVDTITNVEGGADLEMFDADNDGDLDFIAIIGRGTASPEIRLYFNTGPIPPTSDPPTFTWFGITNTMEPTGDAWGSGVGISSGDFDNDYDTDFVAYSARHGRHTYIYAFINNPGTAFVQQQDPLIATWATHAIGIDVGDFDEDGNLDFVMFDYPHGADFQDDVAIYRGTGQGGFFPPVIVFQTTHAVSAVTVQDFDNDGHFDILIGKDDDGDPGQTWLYLGNGAGTFNMPIESFDLDVHETGQHSEGCGRMDSYDAHKDGCMDVIACASGLHSVYYLVGLGTGQFNEYLIDDTLTNPGLVAVPPWGIGYFIIVEGSHYGSLQTYIKYGCDQVFKILREKGFTGYRIFYMCQNERGPEDIDGDTFNDLIDAQASSAKLQWTIENWAAWKVRPTEPLFLYLFDHGGPESFCIDSPGTVSSADLDSWLDTLEAATNTPPHLIYAACFSGSFIDSPGTVSGTGRVIACSCRPNQGSYVWPGPTADPNRWELFSFFFWKYILDGQSVRASFNLAYIGMMATTLPQDPFLDDNGDTLGHPDPCFLLPNGGDGENCGPAHHLKFGRCKWAYPWISYVVAKQYFTWPPPPTVTLWAKVENKTPVAHVRAWMKPPNWTPPPANITLLEPGFECYEMSDPDGDGNWTVNIPAVNFTNHATGPSDFRFIIDAEEVNGMTAISRATGVQFTETGMPPPDDVRPNVRIARPIDGRTVGGMTTVNGTATDDVCLQKVELYVEGNLIGTVNLPPTSNSFFEFNLNTTTVSNGPATILVKAYDTSGNNGTQTLNVLVRNLVHDIATTDIAPSKTVVGKGYSVSINVDVDNEGFYTENLNVTVYVNTTIIATFTNITLTSLETTTITFTSDTSGWDKGEYIVTATATPVPGETDTLDNTYTDGTIKIVMPGDVNCDGKVNIVDIASIAKGFGASIGHPRYDPNCDINWDSVINIIDIALVAKYFGVELEDP